MGTLNIRKVDGGLIRALKVEAAKRGISMRELVMKTLEGLEYGNEQGGSESGVGQNHGEVSAHAGGASDLRNAGENSGPVRSAKPGKRGKGVRDLQGGVSGGGSDQGGSSQGGVGGVLGPHEESQPESSAVDRSPSQDSGGEGSGESQGEREPVSVVYFGPPHRKGCGCKVCAKEHSSASCRVYACGMCRAEGVEDSRRGL
jgi:hypothetical protein